MNCRVIFPIVRNFTSLEDFGKYVKKLVMETRDERYSATFFLFGEDILLSKFNECRMPPEKEVITYCEVDSFIPKLQQDLKESDYVIFSIYSDYYSEGIYNLAYLVGGDTHLFTFKRCFGNSDFLRLITKYPDHHEKLWASDSKKTPITPKRIKIGGQIKNTYLAVCCDITLLPEILLKKDAIVFIPAFNLPSAYIRSAIRKLKSIGHVFINDTGYQQVWDIPFGYNRATIPWSLKFRKNQYLSTEFELE